MPGELTAILCAIFYALSYLLIRKGQADTAPPDHGLLPILCISMLTLDSTGLLLANLHPGTFHIVAAGAQRAVCFAALSGIVGTLFGRLALYRAIRQLGATRGVVIKGLAPVVTLMLVTFTTSQTVEDDDWVALCFLLIAVLLLFFERKFSHQRRYSLALFSNNIFIAIIAAVAQGVGHTFRQLSVGGVLPPIFGAAIDVTTALAAYVCLLLLQGRFGTILRAYRKSLNLSLITAGFCSSVAVLLFFTAVTQIPLAKASVLVATEPVLVAIFSMIFFPKLERLTYWSATASVVVAIGIILISL